MSGITVVDEAFRFVEANPTLLERLYEVNQTQPPSPSAPVEAPPTVSKDHEG